MFALPDRVFDRPVFIAPLSPELENAPTRRQIPEKHLNKSRFPVISNVAD